MDLYPLNRPSRNSAITSCQATSMYLGPHALLVHAPLGVPNDRLNDATACAFVAPKCTEPIP
jgi:hypothetical protein